MTSTTPAWAWTGTQSIIIVYESTIAVSKKPGNAWKKIRARLIQCNGTELNEPITASGEFPDPIAGMRFTCNATITENTYRGITTSIIVCKNIRGESLTEQSALTRSLMALHTQMIEGRAAILLAAYGKHAVAALVHDETYSEAFRKIDLDPTTRTAQTIRKRARDLLPKIESTLLMDIADIPGNVQASILKHAGTDIRRYVQEYPYQLHRAIQHMTFEQDDALFRVVVSETIDNPDDQEKQEQIRTHPARIVAGIVHVLEKQTQDGHCYNDPFSLFRAASTLLGVKNLQRHYPKAQQHPSFREGLYVDDQNAIWLAREYAREEIITERIVRLTRTTMYTEDQVATAMEKVNRLRLLDGKLKPSERQAQAVQTALTNGVSIIAGSAGTGKTTLVSVLVDVADELGDYPVFLAAPTNRAALRLSQITGKKATTIHKLVGSGINDVPTYTQEKPLQVGIYVVDEAAMPNMAAIWMLLGAIPNGSTVVFIGDPNQLQPIGAGNVLRDLIGAIQALAEDKACPIGYVTLGREDVFRSDDTSLIDFWYTVLNPRIRPGGVVDEKPEDHQSTKVQLTPLNNGEDIAEHIQTIFNRLVEKVPAIPTPGNSLTFSRIKRARRIPPIIAQQYKGSAGVIALNNLVQRLVNPRDRRLREFSKGRYTFREGDIVVWENEDGEESGELDRMRRLHGMDEDDGVELATGQLLAITGIYENTVTVQIIGSSDDDTCEIPRKEWKAALGYAITCNKAQGSEWPHVIIVLNKRDVPRKSWTYTAVTRARNAVMVLGHQKFLFLQEKRAERRTGLRQRLIEALSSPENLRIKQEIAFQARGTTRKERFEAEQTDEVPTEVPTQQEPQTISLDDFFDSLD